MKLLDSPATDTDTDSADDDNLSRCRRLLSALSAASSAAACFRGRWSAISATLSRLSAALDDLSDAAGTPHPLVVELFRSLNQTLKLTVDLAQDCRSPEPPAGKLRTQSDIAAASAALDQLLADAELLLRSGALLDASPAEPSSIVTAGSVRCESVRAEAKTLVTRLQIGSPASRVAALDALLSLLLEDDKNVVIAADEGLVKALVQLLGSAAAAGGGGCHEVREKATGAVARVAAVESCRHHFLAEGGVLLHHLARVLESESGGAAREKACVALQALTVSRENAIVIGFRGCLAALLDICRAGTPSSQAAATGVLNNLARIQELHQNFVEEDGVPVLLRVLASGTRLSQENALNCLCNLSAAEESQNLKLSIFKEGALGYLRNYLEGSILRERTLEVAIRLLRNLASFRYIAEIIATNGFLPYIITSLDSEDYATRTEAARAVAELAATVGKTRKEISEAVPRLIRMLEVKAAEEKEAAAASLASLMSGPGYRRVFQKEEKGIVNMVQLLDPLLPNVDRKNAIFVLLSVSHSRKCRKQMVAAGACGFLQSLAGIQVEGAKRLLEILGKGKIFGVFPRT